MSTLEKIRSVAVAIVIAIVAQTGVLALHQGTHAAEGLARTLQKSQLAIESVSCQVCDTYRIQQSHCASAPQIAYVPRQTPEQTLLNDQVSRVQPDRTHSPRAPPTAIS